MSEPMPAIEPPEGIPDAEEGTPSVQDHIEKALQLASEQQMPPSELLGLLHYYAHCVASSVREDAIEAQAEEAQAEED